MCREMIGKLGVLLPCLAVIACTGTIGERPERDPNNPNFPNNPNNPNAAQLTDSLLSVRNSGSGARVTQLGLRLIW